MYAKPKMKINRYPLDYQQICYFSSIFQKRQILLAGIWHHSMFVSIYANPSAIQYHRFHWTKECATSGLNSLVRWDVTIYIYESILACIPYFLKCQSKFQEFLLSSSSLSSLSMLSPWKTICSNILAPSSGGSVTRPNDHLSINCPLYRHPTRLIHFL